MKHGLRVTTPARTLLDLAAVTPRDLLERLTEEALVQHDTGPQFERDRRKDADLVLAGFRVLRFTWRRLTREPAAVVAIIATP